MDDTPQAPEHEVDLLPPPPTRRRRGPVVVAVVATVSILAAVAVAIGVAVRPDAAPRELAVEAPAPAEELASRGAATEDAEIEAVVHAALDSGTPADERSLHFRPAPEGRPEVADVLAGFDGLADRAGADMAGATFVIDHPAPDVALVDVHVPLDGAFGSSALLRDVLVRHGGNGWRVDYESLCSLAGIAPILGGVDACRAEARLHHVDHVPDLAELLDPAAVAAHVKTPPIGAYDTSTSVRTGGWSWLVDYPEAEYGGGGPSTPAELVRVDAGTGAETGRVRLPGAEPRLAVDDDGLWVLSNLIGPQGEWLHPVLTRVDVEQLTATPGPEVTTSTIAIAAFGSTLWTLDPNEVRRFRDGVVDRIWSADGVGTDPTWTATGPVATAAGLWLSGPHPGEPLRRLPADDGPIVLGPTDVAFLAPSGDGVWVRGHGRDAPLRRVGTDGAVRSTLEGVATPDGVHQLWSDGAGGLWLVGDASSDDESSSSFSYDITARPMAVHLDADGEVVEVWWASDGSPNGSSWFGRLGDGLGWVGPDGMRLVTG